MPSHAPDPAASATPAEAAVTRPVRFVHRNRVVEVQGLESTTSVLSWLREHAGCTGTKEGCNEGDCGACTVLVGRLQPAADGAAARVDWQPVNSCIQFLPTLDGKALLTVEDLGGAHPAQQAMVACHGSQCGFCTPGFVMSLSACRDQHAQNPGRAAIADALSGNLCRCTGYRPILEAGERMFSQAAPVLGGPDTPVLLAGLAADPPLHYAAPTPLHAPRTLADLAALREARPQARILAGSTDIGLWVNKQFRPLGELIYVGEVAELQAITVQGGQLSIGAGASLEAAWAALATHWPATREMGLRFASPPVRAAGTMGGNVANGSPIGDSAPVLIALGAAIVLRRGERLRRLPLQEFYLDYMKNQLEAGEFVQAVEVPLPAPGDTLRAYKLSKRFDCDISSVAAGFWLRLDGAGRVEAVRLAFGGMAGIVKRAAGAEAALQGQPFEQAAVQAAMAALDADFQPLTDQRASAAYRRRAARNLLQRFWLETRVNEPLPAAALSVWSLA